MRILKLVLIALLVVVGTLFGLTTANRFFSGSHIPPTIQCGADTLEVSVSDDDSVLLTGVTASDRQDGDLTGQIRIQGVSKLITNDTAKVTYIVFDSDGNAATTSRMIRYTDYERPHFSISYPLVYTDSQDIALLDRLSAADVIDGDLTSSIRVSALASSDDPEVQIATVQVTNSMGDTAQLALPLVIHSGSIVRPVIKLTDYIVYLKPGDAFDPASYLSSVRNPNASAGNISDVQISGTVDTSTPGTYYVYFRCSYNTALGLTVMTVVVE